MAPSEAFDPAASSPAPSAPLSGIAGQFEALPGSPWIAPHRLGLAMNDHAATEAALRHQADSQDIADNLARLEPPLTRKERIGFGICMVIAAGIGALLAIGGVL